MPQKSGKIMSTSGTFAMPHKQYTGYEKKTFNNVPSFKRSFICPKTQA